MADKILSAVVYDNVTKSYANLLPENSPLLINDTGDLVFNTNNLALYNNSSNNKIIRPTGPFSYYFGTNLDNVLIGGNNSTIIGGCQSIINSSDSMISGDYYSVYGEPPSCRFTWFSSITNSTSSKILNAGGWSSIYSSQYSCVTGGQLSNITNGYGSCITNASFSSVLNSSTSRILGSYSFTNTTGGKIFSSEAAYNANLYFGGYNRVMEAGSEPSYDATGSARSSLARFNSVLGGTGWANDLSLFWSTSAGNSDVTIVGGYQNSIITSYRANITNSFCSRISGVTNLPGIGKSVGGGGATIACWSDNQGSSILGSECSCIFNQVLTSLILGGCNNQIISSDYPRYFSGSDSTTRYDRTISHSAILAGAENQINMGASCSAIVGGYQNKICSGFLGSIILGGRNNKLGTYLSGCYSTINNGLDNCIQGGCFQNISAGNSNLIGSGGCNTILNGYGNTMLQSLGTGNLIGNGESNSINSNPTNIGSCYNTIVNGKLNCNYSNLHSTIINGCNNKITSATSNYVFIGGGSDHCIVGNASYSYILGGYKGYIQNGHSGSAVLGDGQNRVHASFNSNNLTLDFANGVYFAQTGIFGQTNFSITPQVNGTTVALSNNVVDLQNNQEVGGIKTFTSIPTVNGNNLALEYNIVDLLTNQYIEGVKTFSTTPQVVLTPVALSDNVVDLQNNQNVGGIKNFSSRPTANGTGVLLIGEAGGGAGQDVVYTTGDQNVSGIKNFYSRVQVNGTGVLLFGEGSPSPIEIFGNGSSQGNAASLNFAGGGISVSTVGSQATISVSSSTQTQTVPTYSNSAGVSGAFAVSDYYFYYCRKPNKWVRTALAEW